MSSVKIEDRNSEELREKVLKLSRPQFKRYLLTTQGYGRKLATYHWCSEHFNDFCKIFFPGYCNLPFSPLHRDAFKDYEFGKRGARDVTAAPRGYSKSVLKAFLKPIHDICYKLESYILIASNTEDQANKN